MGHTQSPGAMATRDGCPGGGSLLVAEVTSAAAPRGLALRPVTGSEIPAIGAMWERCSLATRIARFHAPVRDIPASYLKAVLADPAANVLAACEPVGDVVALASLIRSPGSGTAELGVLVEDSWQRRGIGRRLVAHLITAAPARGITTLTASVLATNTQVADLLRQVPGQFSIALDGEALNVQVCLTCRADARLAQR
jgi:GNAT superfamily N-acetyltransferase